MSDHELCRFCEVNLRKKGVLSHSKLIFDTRPKEENACALLSTLGLHVVNTPRRSRRLCIKCFRVILRLKHDTDTFSRWRRQEQTREETSHTRGDNGDREETGEVKTELSDAEWSDEPVVVPAKKSVGTQLSAGTLRYHRSKGVQTSEKSIGKGTGISEQIKEIQSAENHESEPSPAKKMCVKEEEEEERISEPHLNIKYEARNSDASDQSDLESEYGDAKYIVSASSLRELFERCPICTKHCKVERRRRGLLLSFSQKCPHCLYKRRWQSEMDELLQVPVTDDNIGKIENESDNEILSKKDVLSAHVFINQH